MNEETLLWKKKVANEIAWWTKHLLGKFEDLCLIMELKEGNTASTN